MMKIKTVTHSEIRAEQVRLWGEAKVAANEADIARRFAHLGKEFLATITN